MTTIQDRPQVVAQGRSQQTLPVSQQEINAFFVVVLAAMGAILAIVNALPNGELAESGVILGYLVLLGAVYLVNRFGGVVGAHTVTAILALTMPLALIVAFSQPLPSGVWQLNWSYAPGLGTLVAGALLVSVVYQPRGAVFWSLGAFLLVAIYCCFFMPHAVSLPGEDIAGGIISPHWPTATQYEYSLFDFLCRPALVQGAVTGIGIRFRQWLLRVAHA